MLSGVVALGAYQINHVWAVTMNTAEASKKLAALKELQVKGRRCLVIDPKEQQVKLRLHWLLHGVEDEDVKTALASFGKVTEVTRERWRVDGVSDKGSTTRAVLLQLKSGMKVDDLPHQIRVAGELALVVAPGRPMQCLRCRGSGHVRRECKVPRCSRCRLFGHADADCVRSYAVAAGSAESEPLTSEHMMDVIEAEDAAKGAGSGNAAAEASETTTPTKGGRDDVPTPTEPAATLGSVTETPAENESPQQATDATLAAEDSTTPTNARIEGVSASVKRSLQQDEKVDGKAGGDSEAPPAKTLSGRRSTIKPKPNLEADRRPAAKPTPDEVDRRPPDGHGGV